MAHRIHKCTNTPSDYDIIINIYVSLMYEVKKKFERYLRVNLSGPGARLIKKKLPGRGLTKVEKHWSRLPLFGILFFLCDVRTAAQVYASFHVL